MTKKQDRSPCSMADDQEETTIDEQRPTPVQVARYGAIGNADNHLNSSKTRVSHSLLALPHPLSDSPCAIVEQYLQFFEPAELVVPTQMDQRDPRQCASHALRDHLDHPGCGESTDRAPISPHKHIHPQPPRRDVCSRLSQRPSLPGPVLRALRQENGVCDQLLAFHDSEYWVCNVTEHHCLVDPTFGVRGMWVCRPNVGGSEYR